MAETKKAQPAWGEAEESDWIDISIPYRDRMVYWPGDPEPKIFRIKDRDKGDPVTLTKIEIIDHTGTHVDAPLHFIAGGKTIDTMPLTATVGRARVIEIKDPEVITKEELVPHHIRRGDRILFKTRNSEVAYETDDFYPDYVYISDEAAEYLVERGIRVVGIDYLSVGTVKVEANVNHTHTMFLENGVYILECINLKGVVPGRYDLICLPLLLEKGDAGPARAIIRPA